MCTYFKAETEDNSPGENMGVRGQLLKKRKLWICRSYEIVEAAASSYSETGEFLRYIYSVLVAKNHQNIRSKCLADEFSFTDIFLNSLLYGCGFVSLL